MFVRYASCFLAMQMGRRLLKDLKLTLNQLDHHSFASAQQLLDMHGEDYFNASVRDVDQALKDLYGGQEVSLQQLSATFRRGDLIGRLKAIEV